MSSIRVKSLTYTHTDTHSHVQAIFHPLLSEFSANFWNFILLKPNTRLMFHATKLIRRHTPRTLQMPALMMIQQHAWSLIYPTNFSNECLHRDKFLMRTWKCLCKIAVILLGNWAAHVEQCPCVHVHVLMIGSPLHTITQSAICFSLSWSPLVFCDISSAFWSAGRVRCYTILSFSG